MGGDRAVRVRDGKQSRRHVLTLARSSFYCCFVFVFSLQNRVASDDEDVRANVGDEDDDDDDEDDEGDDLHNCQRRSGTGNCTREVPSAKSNANFDSID